MEIIEFDKAFNVDELKGLIDKAMLQAIPMGVKAKWRNMIAMILMNQNPTLAVKIKLWDIFTAAGFIDATPELSTFSNKIMHCPDIDVVRNIVYIEDVWSKWSNASLLLSKEISSKRESEGILDAMLKTIDNGSAMGCQIRAMLNDHPQIDVKYKHFDAAIEKVLYNNGQRVSTDYTIAPDGVNVTIGGRKYVCGAGNGYYLDAKGALRVSPRWRLVFLPDGNYAIEDSSHAAVIQGDLGAIAGFCGANFGIDIVKVLRDNNITANISNNSSVGAGKIQEHISALLAAKADALDLLEQLEGCVKNVAGDYMNEINAAKKTVKKRVNAIDTLLYHYDIDPETGCPKSDNHEGAPRTIEMTESVQPLFDHIGDQDMEDNGWIYDLVNQLASSKLEKEDEDAEEFTSKGVFKGKIKDIKSGIYGVVQIDDIEEVSKNEIKCACMRIKGDVDDTYTDWSFKIDTTTGDYKVSLKAKDNPEDIDTIFGLYGNAKAFASENSEKMSAFAKAVKDIKLDDGSDGSDGSDDKDVNEGLDKVKVDDLSISDSITVEISGVELNKMDPIISKCKLSNKSSMEYNGSINNPLIIVCNSDIDKNDAVAEIKLSSSNKATIEIKDSKYAKGKTLGELFNV